jgi:glycosyltransferase involved in cell wall biosynthesis
VNVIHLIDTVEKVNFGIWNAALAHASFQAEMGIVSYACFPTTDFDYPNVKNICFDKTEEILVKLSNLGLTPKNTVIVSHGCWRWPTRVGYQLKKKGFGWMAVPHGMLEPWSMQQKRVKKLIYANFIELPKLNKANLIRAVGKPEADNLTKKFSKKTQLIPNGVAFAKAESKDFSYPIKVLFMARLHHKKGIIPLVQAWKKSLLHNNPNYQLTIAGPDDGELIRLEAELKDASNISYNGAVYGEDKTFLLKTHHFYVLPSFSEGFPTSVVEAMSFGLIPVISTGCNFPEVFNAKLAILIEPNEIQLGLTQLSNMEREDTKLNAEKVYDFAFKNYNNQIISEHMTQVYQTLLV